MAVNHTGNKQGAAAETSMAAAFSRQQDQPAQQPQQQAAASAAQRPIQRTRLSDIGSLSRAAMGRNPQSEVITKLSKALEVAFAGIDKSYEVTLIPIDYNNTKSLVKSVIVVAMRDLVNKETGVACHTLILEGSSEPLQVGYQMINNQNVEILRVSGDYNNKTLSDEVLSAVARTFAGMPIWPVDACVVPRDFNVEDPTLVHELAANAATACQTELEVRQPGGFQDVDLGTVEHENSLTVQPTFGNGQSRDMVGAPVRSDIVIDFRAGGQEIPGQQGETQRVKQISRISGYMDLLWAPTEQQTQRFDPWVQQTAQASSPDEFKRYRPRFVMTDLESVQLLTIPAQLLALVTAFTLAENNAWVEAFRPAPMNNSAEVDWKDIGAIGIEANFEKNQNGFGSRVDTKSDAFQRVQGQAGDHLLRLVGSVITPKLLLSLDVPECGPQTWFNGIFAAAAELNGNNWQKANEIIIRAANVLTHGNFSRYFQAGARVASDEFNRIHLGWYVDRHGVKRDLRDVDYLAVLNMVGDRDPEVAREWSDSFARTNLDLQVRLAKRKQIIEGVLGKNNVEFTGFARRVTFEPAFIVALLNACKDTGLSVRTIAPMTDLNQYERAVNPYAMSAGLDTSSLNGSVFNRGFGHQQQQQHGARAGFSRWSQQ
ncbi:hypothetical protein AWB81_01872 [Caballeronia arationis]|uniref:hypothetical protein n=1 Tax=Caballeronia arationis TaxID=1777142 RepID=UPI00074B5191|nr:hypothetical protein [Caballeronia arationis]SAK59635.1 hypothetical protein AWB81_01872 [Caballeronia arationis]